jgi:hypothetical protein
MLLALSGTAWADDWADCYQSDDLDRAIRGCTNIITATSMNFGSLAEVYANRGTAYLVQKQ